MAAKKSSEVERIASSLSSELTSDPSEIARRLQPEVTKAGEQMGTGAYLALVGRNWNDPHFRRALLERVGPDHFLATAKDVQQRMLAPAPAAPSLPAVQPVGVPPNAPGVAGAVPSSTPLPAAPIAPAPGLAPLGAPSL